MPTRETSYFHGRWELGDLESDKQIEEGNREKVDQKDEEDFASRRMRMVTFQEN